MQINSMNTTIRTLFLLSAFAPAVFFAAIAQVYKHGGSMEAYGWIGGGALACVLPLLIISAASKQLSTISFSAKKVESQDWMLVGILISYFVPIITNLNDLGVLALIAVIAAVVLATLDAIPGHPVLHIFRYRFYKVEGANGMVYILIAKRKLLSAADVKSVRQLSAQLLLEA